MITKAIALAELLDDAIGSNKSNNGQAVPPRLSDRRNALDKALIESIGGSDKQAMRIFYTRHNARVYRFILCLIRNKTVAEDLVSDVFLDIWRQAAGFEGKSQASTWLLAIARNKVRSQLRRRSDHQLDEHSAESIEDPADDPEISMHKMARGAIVRKCLGRLVTRSSGGDESRLLSRQVD
jgi:RNA polymerase sigma factor (sigma-70 family)